MKNSCKKTLCILFILLGMIYAASAQSVVFPQKKQPGRAGMKAKKSAYIIGNELFTAKFINKDKSLLFGGSAELGLLPGTELFKIRLGEDSTEVAASDMVLKSVRTAKLKGDAAAARGSEKLDGYALQATFEYEGLEIAWQAVLRDGSHYLRTEMDIAAHQEVLMHSIIPLIYEMEDGSEPSLRVVGNTRGAVIAGAHIFAGLETPTGINMVTKQGQNVRMQGLWSRHTTLAAGKTWNVSAVVGLMAEGQARRSFLTYNERERAVPWRAYPVYISWYELNIDRNNAENYDGNMTVEQCTDIVSEWKKQFFDKYQTGIKAFVWDDGWDSYGTWTFNKNFPNGFSEPDAVARQMGAGIGAWLGPVGGYGRSG
ncbi:MAG: hypothetical protein K2I11_06560, partial [Bacteroides sp.]|nr:hypothetical protein [Bacteroides sp.]